MTNFIQPTGTEYLPADHSQNCVGRHMLAALVTSTLRGEKR